MHDHHPEDFEPRSPRAAKAISLAAALVAVAILAVATAHNDPPGQIVGIVVFVTAVVAWTASKLRIRHDVALQRARTRRQFDEVIAAEREAGWQPDDGTTGR